MRNLFISLGLVLSLTFSLPYAEGKDASPQAAQRSSRTTKVLKHKNSEKKVTQSKTKKQLTRQSHSRKTKQAKLDGRSRAKYRHPARTPRIASRALLGRTPNGKTFKRKGLASWYGGWHHGRKTSNGETFNKNALTAAHKTLPFGTKVLVKNESNGKTVIVRINDRGPYVGQRIIDLSEAAASRLGIIQKGVTTVTLSIVA